MKTAVLVTGAAGFIGSHVVEALLAGGERVVGLDDFNDFYSPTQKSANLDSVRGHPNLHLAVGDIRDRLSVDAAMARLSVGRVIHLAARAGVQPSRRDPALYADVNVRGTAVVLDACARRGVEHIVVASSSSVYGGSTPSPFREDEACDRPMSPYAATKRANELQCWTHHHLTGASVTCLRFFTAFGPRNRPDMAAWSFAEAIVRQRPINLYGRSTQRDFTFVGDIAEGVLAALDRPQGMLVCNLGQGRPVPVTGLVSGLEAQLGRRALVREVPLPPGDVPVTWADCTRAREALGWTARTSLEEGLERFAAWFRAQPEAQPPQSDDEVGRAAIPA